MGAEIIFTPEKLVIAVTFSHGIGEHSVWLSAVKRRTNEIEAESAVNGCRRINLDPGILDFNRFILATTKNRGHRIPLTDGIYGELTLLFVRGRFRPFPWTYADYRSESVIADLETIRLTLKSRKK